MCIRDRINGAEAQLQIAMRKKEIADSCTYAGPSITGTQISLLQAASSQLDASETLAFTSLLAK
eukprot:7135445-Karenia_brevis.AAC.1